jgi:transposase
MDTPRKFVIRLTPAQRQRYELLTRNGQAPAKKILHARILLLSDQDHVEGRWHDTQIAAALGTHVNTVARIRKLFATAGEAPALDRQPRATPPVPPKIDGRVEAHLVALCRTPAPDGHVRWTMTLLASELSRRGIVTHISREAVRRTLKKMHRSPGGSSRGASRSATPPASSPSWKTSSTCTPPRTPRQSR